MSYERRPDLVIYLNGIAVGVIELKRSSVEIGDGVRQLITNQEEIFNKGFFATVQMVFAGSDSQGLRYGTVEELMSAEERKARIAASIIHDFDTKPRLNDDRGTAILVAASIYDACHYYRIFQNKPFGEYCGVITSFEPNHNAISREPANSDERYKFDTYTKYVLKNGQTTKAYEDEAKRRFIEEPANMKLLIVVSKLLTGFDAPSCTYTLAIFEIIRNQPGYL